MMVPKTEQELAETVAAARGALRIIGGGTRPIGKPVTGEALGTSGLSGITLYEPGALTLVAQAGTPVAQIQSALDAENQRLAFEPADHRALLGTSGAPTIGGIVAGNFSGPRRIAVGACRDHMLGLRFVDGSGTVIKNGGRVMKNVTGYDLVKVLTGAYGTLGVISEVSMKVLPKPETSATLVVQGCGVADAVAVMSKALGSPYEVTGAAYEGDVFLRIEGFAASVAYRIGALRKLMDGAGDMAVLEDAASAARWTAIADVTGFAQRDGDVWRMSVKPSDAVAVIEALPQGAKAMLDWGGGLIWVLCPAGTDLRAHIPAVGHATLIRASVETRAMLPVFQPENATVTALSQGLRARFDPRGILNAGLMG